MPLALRPCTLLVLLVSAVILASASTPAGALPATAPYPEAPLVQLPRADLFAFPGANPSPASARSAAFALADRWLGDEPFDHAAGALRTGLTVSPVMHRVSRQDLRARNTQYDETRAFFDAAGGSLAFAPSRGSWGASVYGTQPVLRREENAFTEGALLGPSAPATVRSSSESREWRAGFAMAWRHDRLALGVAPEWTRRSERVTLQREGANLGGAVEAWDFSGAGGGFVVSARYAVPAAAAHAWRLGASLRAVPAFALDGRIPLPGGGGTRAAQVRRESAWEGGASVEAQLTPAFRLMAGGGGRTATNWSGITAANGVSAQAGIAGEYHDPELPWAVRFGIGRESNPGTRESAARQFGLGLGWIDGSLRYDFAILHRGLERSGAPNSSDDRVVASITLAPGHAAPGR